MIQTKWLIIIMTVNDFLNGAEIVAYADKTENIHRFFTMSNSRLKKHPSLNKNMKSKNKNQIIRLLKLWK